MNTNNAATGQLQEAKRRLLEEGVKVYVAGLNAIKEFEREIRTRCRQVLQSRLDDHAKAFKVSLDSLRIVDYDYSDPNGDYADAGVTVKIRGLHDLTYYLSVKGGNKTEPSIAVYAHIWLSLKPAAALAKAFKELGCNDVHSDRNLIWLEEELPADKVSAFEEKLNEVVSKWLQLWERIGGLSALSEAAVQADE